MTAASAAHEIIVEQEQDTMTRLEQQVRQLAAASKDAIADTRTLSIVTSERREEQRVGMNVVIAAPGGLRLAIGDVAHDQFAEKLSIPKPYYQRMLATQPDLLAENMNRWLTVEPEKRLLRMMEPITSDDADRLNVLSAHMTLRAFLGASYRPLDNAELVNSVLPIARQRGAWLHSFDLTEQRLHARFLTTERNVSEVAKVNEAVRVGFYLRNSETGFASLDVAGFMDILKCTNGMIATAQTKVRHVGSKKNGVEDGDLSFLSAQTQRLDNAAIFSRVRDTVIATLSEDRQNQLLLTVAKSKETTLEIEVPTFEFIGRYAENLQLTDAETEVLKEEVAYSNGIEGGFTQFSLAQGITATAKKCTNGDRRAELERAGWQVIEQDATKLLAAGKAATKKRN